MNSIEVAAFWTSTILVIPYWGLMFFMPKHEITKKYVGDIRWLLFPLLIPYSLLCIPAWSHIVFTYFIQILSPDLLVEFFADEQAITLTWLHVLICNLFVGRYVWLRMLAADQPMYVSTPILLICMYSPVGLLLGLLATWQQRDLGGTNFEVQPVSSADV